MARSSVCRATTLIAAWHHLLTCCRRSLHLDLAQWKDSEMTMAKDFEAMRASKNLSTRPFGHGDTIKMVLIYKNRWLLPDNKGGITTCEEPCYVHVSALLSRQAALPPPPSLGDVSEAVEITQLYSRAHRPCSLA
jgi:hypothetical protein